MEWGNSRSWVYWLLLSGFAVGCGTTRSTDTLRSASEMLLVSQAVDQAVSQFDFRNLRGKMVFLDTQYLDGTVDRGYIISSLREQLLRQGTLLQDDKLKSEIIVEARSGAVGTDRHTLLIGTSQMSLPAVVPGQPTQIPEVALIKKTDQRGVAKLAVFAYHRTTGKAVWESGLVETKSTLKDWWVFGAGPFSKGSIRRRTELAGEPLPRLSDAFSTPLHETEPVIATEATKPEEPSSSAKPKPAVIVPKAQQLPLGPPPVQPNDIGTLLNR